MPKKSPFGRYTPEEVFAFEAVTYVIVVGLDVFDVKGKWVFDKKGAVKYYNKILDELMQQLQHGNKKKKISARRVLNSLRIEPLRIH